MSEIPNNASEEVEVVRKPIIPVIESETTDDDVRNPKNNRDLKIAGNAQTEESEAVES